VEDGGVGGQGRTAVVEEAEAYQVVAGDGEFGLGGVGFFGVPDADDAAMAVEGGGDVEIAVDVEGHPLGTAEAAVEDGGVAVRVDSVDGLVGAGGGGGDHEDTVGAEAEVVEGDGGLEGGEDEDLVAAGGGEGRNIAGGNAGQVGGFAGADFEDGAGAVADEEVALAIEGDAGGDAHPLGVGGDGACGGDAVDGALGAGAGVEIAVGTEGEGRDVHDVASEGGDLEVAGDAEDGDGGLLAAGAGDHGEEIPVGVDGGVGDHVEVFDHGNADVGVEGIAGVAVAAEDEVRRDGAGGNADERAGGASEIEVGGSFAEEGLRMLGAVVGVEDVRADDLKAAAGNGGGGEEAVEVGSVGTGCVEQGHVRLGYARRWDDARRG
jgi:hypothetical protein